MKNIIHSHYNEVKKYNLMIINEAALRKQTVSSIGTYHIMGLCNNDTGFACVSEWIMMDYLYTKHVKIKYKDMVANKHHLTETFDITQPIFNIFNLYKEIITIVIKGGQTILS